MPLGSRYAARNHSKVAVPSESLGISEAKVGTAQHREVCEIEGLPAELNVEPLIQSESFEDREVQGFGLRPGNRLQTNVTACCDALSLIRVCDRIRADIEPLVSTASAGRRRQLPLPEYPAA